MIMHIDAYAALYLKSLEADAVIAELLPNSWTVFRLT